MSLSVWYRCNECLELHDDEEDALDCCRPTVDEVFICPICSSEFLSESDAIDCHEVPDDYEPGPTPAQLEKHGQQRLIP